MLVLFDIDDTLLDDAGASLGAVDALHARLNPSLPLREFRVRWFESSRHHFTRYLAGQVDFQEQRRARVRDALRADLADADADEIFDIYLSVYEQNWALFPDVLPCLDALGAAQRLGVVSNGNAQQQRLKLSRLGILDRFSCVVLSEDCGWGKPDPRIFARACELGDATPPNVIHVGDRRDIDVLGAIRAGLRAVWLDRRDAEPELPLSPDVTRITTLAHLPGLIGESRPTGSVSSG
jgi:putative hydrolase of the HAD superfamily